MVLLQTAIHAVAVKCGGKFIDSFLKGNIPDLGYSDYCMSVHSLR